jgi:heterogeneous nuclear rnp K-like protein 2
MPDADGTRKRSRSPSDSEAQQQSSKRPNTGLEQPSRVKAEEDHVSAASSPVVPGTDSNPAPGTSELALPTGDTPAKPEPGAPAPIGNISMRCLIVTQDASIIIGKAGAHVNEIREKSNARVTVSESLPGNPERILNVSGPLDAVSKV